MYVYKSETIVTVVQNSNRFHQKTTLYSHRLCDNYYISFQEENPSFFSRRH